MSRFLKEDGLKGSCEEGEPVGKRALVMSSVRNSSDWRTSDGSWIVFTGVLGDEKKLNRDVPELAVVLLGVVLIEELNSSVGGVGRLFASFPAGRSGLVEREEDIVGAEFRLSRSETGRPSCTGAEDPVNHDASPPRDLSVTLIFPSLSPVRVGMKFASSSSRFFSLAGLCAFRSGEFGFVRDVKGRREGSSAVKER